MAKKITVQQKKKKSSVLRELQKISSGFEKVEEVLHGMEKRMSGLENLVERFDNLESQFERMQVRMIGVEQTLGIMVDRLNVGIDKEARQDKKIKVNSTGIEKLDFRVTKVEAKVHDYV